MIKQKVYEADDKMIQLISDNYSILQALGSFGINLGFGDKTVREVCCDNKVDCATFLAVVNYAINGYYKQGDTASMDVPTLMHYLHASHTYYMDFQLPFIRKELEQSLDESDEVARLILKFYDAYAQEIRKHMKYEERVLFPYVDALLDGLLNDNYDIATFAKHHGQTDVKLKELKNIIIKYLPGDSLLGNRLTATLYDLYNNEKWLELHGNVENDIFVPVIQRLEDELKHADVSRNLAQMIFKTTGEDAETLSDREQEVVVSLVQGMSNKEIADHLSISLNTVTTHRRNIARKLQIHSPAGLTIYAIVNGLIDISQVKM